MQLLFSYQFSLSYFLKIVEKLLLFIGPIYMNYVCYYSISYLRILPPTRYYMAGPLIPVYIHSDIMADFALWLPKGN